MRFIGIIVMGALGCILGLGLASMVGDGYFQPWEALPAPPQEPSEIIPGGAPSLYVRTLDGTVYYYSDRQNEGWIQGTIPQDILSPTEVTGPCDFSSPDFSPLTKPPKDIKDCVQDTTEYADGYIHYILAIDGDGDLWMRKRGSSPYEGIFRTICFSAFGLLLGIVTALVVNIIIAYRRQSQERTNQAD
jgi:hypothetical protein